MSAALSIGLWTSFIVIPLRLSCSLSSLLPLQDFNCRGCLNLLQNCIVCPTFSQLTHGPKGQSRRPVAPNSIRTRQPLGTHNWRPRTSSRNYLEYVSNNRKVVYKSIYKAALIMICQPFSLKLLTSSIHNKPNNCCFTILFSVQLLPPARDMA